MRPLKYRIPALALALLVCPAAFSAEAKKKDAAELQRPAWGKVSGWVLDARSRQPIPQARVAVEVEGAFPETGKSTALTAKDGRYTARAPLGSISSRFDWGRLLTMSPISLLISPKSVTKQTKIVDVVQANLRVEADGYRPFLGRVRAAVMDAGRFSITLDDVWLAPAGADLVSFTPERMRLEVAEKLTVEPAVASPGQKVRITLVTLLPVARGFSYRAYATSSSIRLVEGQPELRREKRPAEDPQQKDTADQSRVVFSREITLPKSSADRWAEIGFFLVRDGDTMLRRRDTRALLQIVRTPEERTAAQSLAAGFAKALRGEEDQALRDYAAARAAAPAYPLGHLLYGDLCLRLHRPLDALPAFEKLVELDPRDYEVARPRAAQALIETGRPADALAQLEGAEEVVGKKLVPARVALCRARIFAAQRDFTEVDRWLAKAGDTIRISPDTLAEINLARMSQAVERSPENADLRLSYARVLEGAGRREEALAQLRRAAALDPADPWAFLDLGDLLLHLGQREEGLANLRHALELAPDNSEARLALADAYRDAGRFSEALPHYRAVAETQKLSLRARHFHALMLYATGDAAAARRELAEVVALGRAKGDLRDNGIPFLGPGILGSGLYFGPKRRLVAGFSIPEAAADVAILEALTELERHPDNGLLWQNVGSALLDLDLPSLAVGALNRSRECDPALLETRFLLGVTHRRLGETAAARAELAAVIAANPLHPRARLELAQLLTDQGDVELAQAQLLAHARNYPYDSPPRPQPTFGG